MCLTEGERVRERVSKSKGVCVAHLARGLFNGARARPHLMWEARSGFRVQGSGFRVQGAGCRVQGSGLRVWGSGVRVQGRRRHPRAPPPARDPAQLSANLNERKLEVSLVEPFRATFRELCQGSGPLGPGGQRHPRARPPVRHLLQLSGNLK